MANTATKVSATPNMLVYRLVGDGTVAGPTIANATLLDDMVDGPLKDAWNEIYETDGTSVQSTMRNALLGSMTRGTGILAGSGGCRAVLQLIATGTDTTAQVSQPVVDVDTDAITATKAEINIGMSDTTGQIAFLTLIHNHTSVA